MANDHFWYPTDAQPVFEGGQQPYAPRRTLTPPSSVDNPPFANPQRRANFVQSAVVPSQPDPWTYTFEGGWEPYRQRQLDPQITAVPVANPPGYLTDVVNYSGAGLYRQYLQRPPLRTPDSIDNPPFVYNAREPWYPSVVQAWQPPDPPPVQRGPLSPGIPGQSVDKPPVNGGRLSNFGAVLGTWQPPDPQPTQIYARVVQPPTGNPYQNYWLKSVVGSWQPPDPQPTQIYARFIGIPVVVSADNPPGYLSDILNYDSSRSYRQGLQRPPLTPPSGAVAGPDNPPGYLTDILNADAYITPRRLPQLNQKVVQGINYDDPPKRRQSVLLYNVGRGAYGQRRPLFIPGSSVDNPPKGVSPWLSTILASWQPPDPQPTQGGKLNPSALAVPADNPPTVSEGRSVWLPPIIASWQPPDPQPTQRGPSAPGIPGQSVDNPPRLKFGLSGVLASWLPPDPAPPLPGKRTPPSVDNPPRLVRQPQPTQLEPPFYLQARFLPSQVAAAPQVSYAPTWLSTILNAWQPVDPPLTFLRKLNPSTLGVQVDNPPGYLTDVINYNPPGRLPAQYWRGNLSPFLITPPSAVNNPPFSYAGRNPLVNSIVTSWLPPPPAPILPGKINPSSLTIPVSNPPGYLTDVVNYSTLNRLPYQYSRGNLNPSLLAVQADNPPFGLLVTVIEPWIPEPPSIELLRVKKILPVSVDNPPFLTTVFEPWTRASTPADSLRPRTLNPSILAVQVDRPPLRIADLLIYDIGRRPLPQRSPFFPSGATAPIQNPYTNYWLSGVLTSWQPPDLSPILPRNLSPGIPGQSVDNPQFGENAYLVGLWDPDAPLPTIPRKLYPSLLTIRADNPPLRIADLLIYDIGRRPLPPRSPFFPLPITTYNPYRNLWLTNIVTSWLPPDPLPTLPRKNSPGIPGQSIDNPRPYRFDLSGTLRYWQPPDPPPTLPGKLNPSTLAVTVNNPPFSYPGRNPALNPIIASWQPPDPQAPGPGKLNPSTLAVPANNPPFSSMGRWVQTITIGSAWEPPPPQPQNRIPGNPGSGPPVSPGQFTVSGHDVSDIFPVYSVSYTYAAITKRTN